MSAIMGILIGTLVLGVVSTITAFYAFVDKEPKNSYAQDDTQNHQEDLKDLQNQMESKDVQNAKKVTYSKKVKAKKTATAEVVEEMELHKKIN